MIEESKKMETIRNLEERLKVQSEKEERLLESNRELLKHLEDCEQLLLQRTKTQDAKTAQAARTALSMPPNVSQSHALEDEKGDNRSRLTGNSQTVGFHTNYSRSSADFREEEKLFQSNLTHRTGKINGGENPTQSESSTSEFQETLEIMKKKCQSLQKKLNCVPSSVSIAMAEKKVLECKFEEAVQAFEWNTAKMEETYVRLLLFDRLC